MRLCPESVLLTSWLSRVPALSLGLYGSASPCNLARDQDTNRSDPLRNLPSSSACSGLISISLIKTRGHIRERDKTPLTKCPVHLGASLEAEKPHGAHTGSHTQAGGVCGQAHTPTCTAHTPVSAHTCTKHSHVSTSAQVCHLWAGDGACSH